ncbi:MAG: hypothetical protein AAF570_18940, partial [Bacteroidota bacterium]
PDGPLGIVKNIFNYTLELNVSGTIRQPLADETPATLKTMYQGAQTRFQYPWTIQEAHPKGVPGILLAVDLDIDYSLLKDKVQFVADKLWLYSPIHTDWQLPDTNPTFDNMQAFTGSIELPDADISMKMISPQYYGTDFFELQSQFEGLSIANLSKLAGLSGGENPLSSLPEEIQNIGDKLGGLSLSYATFKLDYSDITRPSVSNICFAIGMPELNWEIWKDKFELNNIFCEFRIDHPFATKNSADERHLAVTLYGQMEVGNVPVSVYATRDEGWTLYAEMDRGQTLPLKKLLSEYAPDLPPPSDLTIDTLRMSISPGRNYEFAMAMARGDGWKIPLGPKEMTVRDVSMSAAYEKGAGFSGAVNGILEFGELGELFVAYETPGDITMRSRIEEIKLRQLLNTLTNQAFNIPKSFDLKLINNTVLIQKAGSDYKFQLTTELKDYGLVAMEVQKNNGKWGAAVGIDLPQGLPENMPGLEALGKFGKIVNLSKASMILSSFDNPNFQFPSTAAFNNPILSASSIPVPQAGGVIAGLNVNATWNIDTKKKEMKLMRDILGLDPSVDITLQVGKNPSLNSRLFVKYN